MSWSDIQSGSNVFSEKLDRLSPGLSSGTSLSYTFVVLVALCRDSRMGFDGGGGLDFLDLSEDFFLKYPFSTPCLLLDSTEQTERESLVVARRKVSHKRCLRACLPSQFLKII